MEWKSGKRRSDVQEMKLCGPVFFLVLRLRLLCCELVLDFGDGLGGIETLGASLGACEDLIVKIEQNWCGFVDLQLKMVWQRYKLISFCNFSLLCSVYESRESAIHLYACISVAGPRYSS